MDPRLNVNPLVHKRKKEDSYLSNRDLLKVILKILILFGKNKTSTSFIITMYVNKKEDKLKKRKKEKLQKYP